MFAHGITVTRLRKQLVTDPYSGKPTLGSWENPDRLELPGVAIGPSSSTQQLPTDGQQVNEQVSLYAGYDVDVRSDDRIDADGTIWHCDGNPLRYRNPFTGWQAGSETRLTRVTPDGL